MATEKSFRSASKTTSAGDASKNTVQSLAKGFRILEAFSAQEPELTMAEVARRSGLDNATAFRFLNTLVDIGYVQRVPDTRLFRLSLKVLDLGFNAIAHADLRTRARPILRELVGEVNEAASVGVLDGADVLYTERVLAGLTRLGVDIRIGSRIPAYSTAVGYAILAWLPEQTQIRVLEAQPRQKLTPTTQTDLDTILERLKSVRAQGYAVSNQETVSGLFVVAAPVLDVDGVPIAGLSVAAPALNTSLDEFESATAPAVVEAAASLSRSLQSSGGFIAPDMPPAASPTPRLRLRR
ncbi:IclR family transcriptional regulator [Cupriavidus sp. UYPR2.512]|uniref:IclR family transcriptional regulator n=1 Tax=Cupriavidus sp. UYPR2.512 TaxID=1080187 RepID=UPI00035EAF3D|nr:IclR family transcriptional regulator C-terminal domain-containing protein [Cupriavidus sp. UYPR2.512]UIF87612.1 helix-turn-helix domain-containing protein [Cupriavidus necator]